MRYRSNNGYSVPMTIRAPYGGGVHGALYHSQSVEAFFTHVPGLKVVVPSTPYDARGLLRAAIRDDDPVLFFEHKKMYRSVRGDVPDTDYVVPLGQRRRDPSRVAGDGHRLRADGALRARGGRPRRRGRHQRRGHRPADPPAARQGDRARLGPQDRQVPDRLRGQPVRRLRRRGRGDRRRGGLRLPRRPGHADRRARGAGRAVQPRPRGLVHGLAREDRRRDPHSSRPTEAETRRTAGGSCRWRILDHRHDEGDGFVDRHSSAALVQARVRVGRQCRPHAPEGIELADEPRQRRRAAGRRSARRARRRRPTGGRRPRPCP